MNSEERTIILHLCYDGSCYHGWQIQKNAVTVQETLEHALSAVCGRPVKTVGCGRTDAGVHARHYCVSFRTTAGIPADRIPFAVNTFLPRDISVLEACDGPESFNAILSCVRKEYIYRILNAPLRDPFLDRYACFYPQRLDMDRFCEAAAAFEGTHDFRAVRSVGTETRTTVRTVHYCRAEKTGDVITVAICADGFLYNMCRAMVGTMVYASYGKLNPQDIPALLEKGDRRLTGPTMPPQGLFMNHLWYPDFELSDSSSLPGRKSR
ncbi:MAG: tRNA pseudouridine(38-40) synthase TruA [Oscillospiraceae bacterium]|nr:tRNA pseudouridine(38-40) synthase TruA [Oscillospiraceae bacterium]MBQ5788555.1 tRNA pseudouridine(38-40) synthase TruA [Oscillospiraceae bacterium]